MARDESREAAYEEADRALSEGDYDTVHELLEEWAEERPPDPEACALVGLAYFHEGDPVAARPFLETAVRAEPDDHEARCALGACAFLDGELARARRELERVLEHEPSWAEAHWWLARLYDWQAAGDPQLADLARRHFERAARLDPASFTVPLALSDAEFDAVLEDAVRSLPPRIAHAVEEVTIAVEPYPDPDLLEGEDDLCGPDLLGLYTGTALPDRSHQDSGRLPDVIHVFKRNLEIACADREELVREIRDTLLHEVGHYLGMDEEELEKLGL